MWGNECLKEYFYVFSPIFVPNVKPRNFFFKYEASNFFFQRHEIILFNLHFYFPSKLAGSKKKVSKFKVQTWKPALFPQPFTPFIFKSEKMCFRNIAVPITSHLVFPQKEAQKMV